MLVPVISFQYLSLKVFHLIKRFIRELSNPIRVLFEGELTLYQHKGLKGNRQFKCGPEKDNSYD